MNGDDEKWIKKRIGIIISTFNSIYHFTFTHNAQVKTQKKIQPEI